MYLPWYQSYNNYVVQKFILNITKNESSVKLSIQWKKQMKEEDI